MFSSVSGFHHRDGDPYETGSDTPIPSFIMLFFLSVAVAVLHYRGFGEDWQGEPRPIYGQNVKRKTLPRV
jgi:hypothetical protein